MNGLSDVPRYVRYDFLVTFLGLLSFGFAWYFTNVNKINTNAVNLLLLIGIPLIIWGFGEMYNNYKEERDLIQLKSMVEKKEIFDEMVKHNILDKDKSKSLVELLKKEIVELIEKEK